MIALQFLLIPAESHGPHFTSSPRPLFRSTHADIILVLLFFHFYSTLQIDGIHQILPLPNQP